MLGPACARMPRSGGTGVLISEALPITNRMRRFTTREENGAPVRRRPAEAPSHSGQSGRPYVHWPAHAAASPASRRGSGPARQRRARLPRQPQLQDQRAADRRAGIDPQRFKPAKRNLRPLFTLGGDVGITEFQQRWRNVHQGMPRANDVTITQTECRGNGRYRYTDPHTRRPQGERHGLASSGSGEFRFSLFSHSCPGLSSAGRGKPASFDQRIDRRDDHQCQDG